ncbi:hypothetical protein [Bartonella sp. ML70XJBT.G]|uniref:hypothetical protein n=1 Tax=Bartonella sp. ML70XJBT.G TaxID=3019093 RepID=UPI0023611651|nr:hypothetical protein [Bartonella sp. ML70XJBT.G]
MVNILLDNIAVGGLMLQSSWFLPFLLLLCFWVVSLAFLYRVAACRGVMGLMFWRWVMIYGILAAYLGFVCAGVGCGAVSAQLLCKGAVFSCLFGIVLGLLHGGVKSLPAAWGLVVQALAFCCFSGVILLIAFEGVMHIGIMRGIFLKGLVFALLLKLLVALLMREGDDAVLQRSLRVLNCLLVGCIWGCALMFVAAGVEHLGWSWLWFSNVFVLIGINGFFSPFLYQGARCALVVGEAFFKRVGLMGRSR